MEFAERLFRPLQLPKKESKRGRRPWTPPDLTQVESLASSGLTYSQIADALGIHLHTLLRKRSQLEVFAEALKRGRAKGISAVANKLWEMAIGGNVVAAIFFLKCQGGWRELQHIDLNLVPTEADSEARAEQLRLLRAMTPEERRTIREINERAEERLTEQLVTKTRFVQRLRNFLLMSQNALFGTARARCSAWLN